NIYVTGDTGSTNFPAVNPIRATKPGNAAAFVAELNAAGTGLVYSTYFGGDTSFFGAGLAATFGTGIAVDGSGNAYVTGRTDALHLPTRNAFQATPGDTGTDANDAFVLKVNAGGGLGFATYLGGSGDDVGTGVAVDGSGNAYVFGDTTVNGGFPVRNPVPGASSALSNDLFLTALRPDGQLTYPTFVRGGNLD